MQTHRFLDYSVLTQLAYLALAQGLMLEHTMMPLMLSQILVPALQTTM